MYLGSYLIDKLAMDGTSAIKDLVSGASFAVAGTPTTATLLGATAPVISATQYTSCKIATPFAAGSPLSILCVVNAPWAGDDSAWHYLFDNYYDANNRINIIKYNTNTIRITTTAAAGQKYMAKATTAANWAANVNHVIIATLAANNTQQIFLDGVAGTTSGGTAGREASVGADAFIGTTYNSLSSVGGAILHAIWGRVLTSGEITALSSLAAWATLYNSLALTMPLATATGGASAPTIFPSAAVPAPVAQATGAALIPTVNPLATVNMPLATAMAYISLPTPSADTAVNMPVTMAMANAPVPVVAVPTSFLGSPKQISGVAKDKFEIDGRV